jgi:NADPH:quinone reductase-like Zn-dependent oxidoreductase
MSYQKVVITDYGSPEVLKVVTDDRLPMPQKGEVRIKMLATSACFTDTMIRKGRYFGVKQKPPFSLGYDVIGIVDELGEGVTHLQKGQRVAELTVTGAYSEYLCIPAAHCVPVPDRVNPAEAVSLVLTYVTAYQMLHRIAKVNRGSRILVHGASGAVGTALIQLGTLLELQIYGTVSEAYRDFISSMGTVPIDYQKEDFVEYINTLKPKGVDTVFDGIGGRNFKRSFRCLRKGGVLVAYGSYGPFTGRERGSLWNYADIMIRSVLTHGKSTVMYNIVPFKEKHPDWFRDDLATLLNLLEEGKIKPVISVKLPLLRAAEAHRILEARGVKGKIVLVTQSHNEA